MEEAKLNKKKSKKGLVIAIVIILLIVILAIGYIVFFNDSENNESSEEFTTGVEWGDMYYEYLETEFENDEYSKASNIKLKFIEDEDSDFPVMIVTYDNGTDSYANVYMITESDNENNEVKVANYSEYDAIMYLYNTSQNEYDWYISINQSDTETNYFYLIANTKNIIEYEGTDEETIESVVTIADEDSEEATDEDGNNLTLTAFEKNFIEAEIDITEASILQDTLQDNFLELVSNYKTNEELLTDEVKEAVEAKLEEISELKEKIESLLAPSGTALTLNGYTISAGTYIVENEPATTDGSSGITSDITITLKADGTYEMSYSNPEYGAGSTGTIQIEGDDTFSLYDEDGELHGWYIVTR